MVRLVDTLQRCGYYALFAALLIFATYAFLTDPCASVPDDSLNWLSQFSQWLADAAYRASQLFVLEYNRNCADPSELAELSWKLEAARYLILFFSVATVVAFLVPHVARRLLVAVQSIQQDRRAIVLGYDPVGQNIARELTTRSHTRSIGETDSPSRIIGAIDRWWSSGRFVTAVHKGVTPPLLELAKRDNILLVDGDPSDPKLHARINIHRSSCVIAAVGSDMQTLDAAVSARQSLPLRGHKVRAILSDQDLASTLAEAAPRGFLGAKDVEVFSLATEAARLLVAEARFDRTALEKKQQRVHLMIVGCGAQGEAIAIETLLTAWRVGLKPPIVSILDRNFDAVRKRFVRRAPALFPRRGQRPLPLSARVRLNFEFADIETVDFASDETIASLLSQCGPATAWVFAAGDDSLNLRGSAALHLAMLKKHIPPAPIYVRIWSGHQGDTPVLSSHSVGLARAFGALESTLAATPACDDNPDQIAEELHDAYLQRGREMSDADASFAFEELKWLDLSETKRNANRRLHRHAVMKFEDLGGQWRHHGRAVPVVDPELRDPYVAAEERMNYGVMGSSKLPANWRKSNSPSPLAENELEKRAETILRVAITEHNRWVVDRALDGWRPAAQTNAAFRDEVRRFHPYMCHWSKLDANTRRWDAVLLHTLVVGEKGRDLDISAWKRRVSSVLLAIRTETPKFSSNMPDFLPLCRFIPTSTDVPLDTLPTELHIAIGGEPRHNDLNGTIESACRAFRQLLVTNNLEARLCRVRFDFFEPPGEGMLAMANALGSVVSGLKISGGADGGRVNAPIEVSSLWDWKEARPPVFGFVGHRDLTRMSGDQGLARFLETFFATCLANGEVSGLVSGYAPGSDRIAVNAWIALGAPKPRLIFPFAQSRALSKAPSEFFLTAADAEEGAPEWLRNEDISVFAMPKTTKTRKGVDAHVSQASDILGNSDVLVAVYDGNGPSGNGSVGDTIARAVTMDKPVIIINRDGKGNWHHHRLEAKSRRSAKRRLR